jgi:alpha-tubulin suppressor-like RCC1 family protein
VKNNIHVTDIATGWRHAIFLDDKQRVYSCGWNLYGTLGLGDTGNRSVPELVKIVSSIGVLSVKCGWQHSLFLTKKGVFATGLSDNNRLGLLTLDGIPEKVTTPLPVKFRERFGRKAVQIACSASGSFFIDKSGNVYAVGKYTFGESSEKLRLVYSGGIKAYLSPRRVDLDKLSKRLNRQRIRRRRVDVIVRYW